MLENEDDKHKIRELEQEKSILQRINKFLTKNNEELKTKKESLEKNITESNHKAKELEQQKMFLTKSVKQEEQKNLNLSKKHILTIAGAVVIIGIISTAYSLFVVELVGKEYQVDDLGDIRSSYVIQNLKGDKINTWLSWRLIEGTTLYVNIVNAEKYPEKAELIKDVILSKETLEIDNSLLHKGPKGTTSTYYLGWTGALEKATEKPSELFIPKNIKVITNTNGAGEIIIRLDDKIHGDGYSGLTKTTSDEYQHQILKSEITIYDVENLSENQLKAIARHELGHAFGLSHSTDPQDLMYATLKTGFPYISSCIIDAIAELYNGSEKSAVVCEK